MTFLHLLLAGTAPAAMASASPLPPPPQSGSEQASAPAPEKKAERRVRLTVGLLVSGSPMGDIAIDTTGSGTDTLVDFNQLSILLRPIVTQQIMDDLTQRASSRGFVPISDLSSEALPIAFDLAALQLKINLPVDARARGTISITNPSAFNAASLTAPEDFSFGVTFSIAQRIIHERDFGDMDRDPLTIAARGYANIGGMEGLTLTFLTGYRENGKPVRQQTTLFHDDVDNAIRYSLGDLDPQSFGAYDSPTSLVGVGVERLYQTIQPYRNLRPAGRGGLVIERPSRVDVMVNGSLYRTLDLGPGQYDLRDFPFLDGLNDVQLVVRDDTGRQETIGLSFFSDTELLDPGISIFSAAFGFRQNRFGDFQSTGYERSPVFTGFYQQGVSDRLTLGGALQADKHNALVSSQVVFASPVGIFGFQTAADLHSSEKAQYAALASYRLRSASATGRQSSFDLDLEYRTRDFSPMEAAADSQNRYRYDITARYQTELWENAFGTFGGSYSKARRGFDDLISASAGITQRFGRLNFSVNYVYLDKAPRADHRATFSLSFPLSGREQVRTGYETDRNRVYADYDLLGFQGLDQTNAHVSLARNDEGRQADIDVEHYSNRFQATLHHSYDRTNGFTREVTDLGAAFGIGYAGGKLALGREADRGFTIVSAHPTLEKSQITASDNYALGPSAKTGSLGPALVPTQRPYQPNSIKVDVDNLPVGYDIGAGRIDILPGAGSGYVLEVGSAASNTVMGRVLNAKGEPAEFLAGTLEPISGKDAKPAPFFTNRNGRMVAQKVAPGRYTVTFAGKKMPGGEIIVPENPDGPVNIGVLTVKE